ncbi:hypothetical protein [Winogradskyella sp.]|uniref:hypothetical protein n=1 Tax=Winogradskyella sp. TaxID=1883156 RepID=UPI003BAC162E
MKNKPLITRFCLILIAVVLSCGSANNKWRKELEKEWLGKSKSELIEKYGEPTKIYTVDEFPETEVYLYHHTDFTPDIPPNNYSKDFFINKNGIIHKVKTYRW